MMESKVVPGGGACELAVANHLSNRAKLIQGEEQFPFKAVAKALEGLGYRSDIAGAYR